MAMRSPIPASPASVLGSPPNVARERRDIGFVFQDAALLPWRTALQNVQLPLQVANGKNRAGRATPRELLELVGLDPQVYRERLPRELSGGQRQRVGVARALAADPPILLLDEPFRALDPITRSEIQQEFRELQRRLLKTMIFVTHDIREAFLLATRIGLMKDGRLIAIVRTGPSRVTSTALTRSPGGPS